MTRKAEKLARELITLRLGFSDNDFDEAIEIISSGRNFNAPIAALKTVSALRLATTRELNTTKFKMKNSESQQKIVEKSLVESVNANRELKIFIERFLNRDELENSSAVRVLFDKINVSLPKRIPSRVWLAKKLVEYFSLKSLEDQNRILDEVRETGKDTSSLQLWSDVIVKRREV